MQQSEVNFIVAGKLIFMAWSILKMQSEEVLAANDEKQQLFCSDWDFDVHRGPVRRGRRPMLRGRHTGADRPVRGGAPPVPGPVSLVELLDAFEEARAEAEIADARARIREQLKLADAEVRPEESLGGSGEGRGDGLVPHHEVRQRPDRASTTYSTAARRTG